MTYDKRLPDEYQENTETTPMKELTQKAKLDLQYPITSFREWSVFFLILAIITGIVGFFVSRSDAGVVGGDAYNYIIGAGRGTAIACVAIVFALVSVVLALYELTNLFTYDIKKRDQE